jgi:hypothetical protein
MSIDGSPTYFDVATVATIPALIRGAVPHATVLMIGRNPIDRAVSHFQHFGPISEIGCVHRCGWQRVLPSPDRPSLYAGRGARRLPPHCAGLQSLLSEVRQLHRRRWSSLHACRRDNTVASEAFAHNHSQSPVNVVRSFRRQCARTERFRTTGCIVTSCRAIHCRVNPSNPSGPFQRPLLAGAARDWAGRHPAWPRAIRRILPAATIAAWPEVQTLAMRSASSRIGRPFECMTETPRICCSLHAAQYPVRVAPIT